MTTKDQKDDATTGAESTATFQNGVPLLPRAGGSPNGPAAQGKNADKKDEPVVGMPEGYEPDTSVTYVAGKEGKDGKDGTPDQIKNADGTTTDVSSHNPAASGNAMATLPEGHTYRDRVEAQARALGVEVVDGETLELLLWKIRMQASS